MSSVAVETRMSNPLDVEKESIYSHFTAFELLSYFWKYIIMFWLTRQLAIDPFY